MNRKKPQQGMILVLVMILILPLTLMAITMMQSGREQLKMSSATSHGLIAKIEVESQMVTFWSEHMTQENLSSKFKHENLENIKVISNFTIDKNHKSSCARSVTISSSNIIKQCHYWTISSPTSDVEHITGKFIAELPLVLFDGKNS
jgi:type IV pilus assembly protein PilX